MGHDALGLSFSRLKPPVCLCGLYIFSHRNFMLTEWMHLEVRQHATNAYPCSGSGNHVNKAQQSHVRGLQSHELVTLPPVLRRFSLNDGQIWIAADGGYVNLLFPQQAHTGSEQARAPIEIRSCFMARVHYIYSTKLNFSWYDSITELSWAWNHEPRAVLPELRNPNTNKISTIPSTNTCGVLPLYCDE